MEMENKLREDLWKAIQAHYERNDFTEAVRDCMYHICDILREKSGLQDKDGTKLVEAALLGSNPGILINKNESTSEKDIQQGIGNAFKGLIQSVRNPLSHEKTYTYTKDEADAIILYSNFLLNRVDCSGGATKIEDVTELLLDEDFTDSEEYALLLLKEVPAKKRYDLLLHLFSIRVELPQHKLKYFLNALMESLTKAAKNDFVRIVSNALMRCKDDRELRMYCHYFMTETFDKIDKLAQLRIEDLAFKSIRAGTVTYQNDPSTNEEKASCSSAGSLGTWFSTHLDLLSNKDKIIALLIDKTDWTKQEEDYVFEYFGSVINDLFNSHYGFTEKQIATIKRKLSKGDEHYYNILFEFLDLGEDEIYQELFGLEYRKCETVMDAGEGELPF